MRLTPEQSAIMLITYKFYPTMNEIERDKFQEQLDRLSRISEATRRTTQQVKKRVQE